MGMICRKLFGIVLLFWFNGMGQASHLRSGNGYISAGAYSARFIDAFSFASNPACLAGIKTFTSGLLAERKWMLKELDNFALSVDFPVLNSGLGVALEQSGDAAYSEQTMGLAYGKNLGRLQIGIRFTYLHDRPAGYKEIDFGSSGIGILFHVSENLISGCELSLPVFSNSGKPNPEKAPQFFRMGFGYEPGPGLFMAVQVEKISGIPLNVIPYVEYRYEEQFIFCFGINSLGGVPYFKTGWKKSRLSVQLYTLFTPLLGFSSGLVLLWEAKTGNR